MSSKKKKKNQNKQAQKAQPKPANPSKSEVNEEDIPVQSFSEMLAFAHETEAKDDKAEAEEKAKREAEEKAKQESEEKAKQEAEEKAKREAEEKAKQEAEEKAKQEAEEKAKQAAKEKPQHRAPNGMPITAEEAARQMEAEDALDRDLHAARQKKLREEAVEKRKREEEIKREEARMEKAQQAQQRHANAAQSAKKLEEAKAAKEVEQKAEAKAVEAKKKTAVKKHFNNMLNSMAAIRALAVLVIILVIGYAGAFMYTKSQNEEFYKSLETALTSRNKIVSDASMDYAVPSSSQLSLEQKQSMNLSAGLADSDKDGLSDYYEINTSGTDPVKADSDGDGVADGREVRAGLDPLNTTTDGSTPDGDIIIDTEISADNVGIIISGMPKTAYTTLAKLDNNSIQGTPGLVGYAYEFYTDKNFDSCEIIFGYTDEQLAKSGIAENALSIFRFDANNLVFEKITSKLDSMNNTVSAQITSGGVYALCDTAILAQKGETNIFFLIDNSGSMYPEELCANSEENDVEFKRLDFATNLIDMLGVDANYGAGEFSGSYTNITPISDNYENVKQKISDIRNKNQTFSGTEIAGALTAAVAEFGSISGYDKNYIILLTDGMPSNYNEAKEKQAIELARKNNITIFTIGLGKYIDSEYLFDIAAQTNGQFFQASNADALENIYTKIQNFMSYNRITIEEESGKQGFVVADSGFNVLKDGIGYNNFRADFAADGADAGIAGLICDYYTGELELSAPGYTTADGTQVPGYDISHIEGFADGKADLNSYEIGILKSYNQYLAIADKWDFGNVKGGVLHYTEDTRDFIDSNSLKVITAPYEFEAPEETGVLSFLRTLTFNRIKEFNSYECVLIDSKLCQGDDLEIMNMIQWYSRISEADGKCKVYDFGYEGDAAFDALINELTTGKPAVITYGGSAMNAVRIARDTNNPDVFVIDAYDSNTPDRSTKINLVRTPVYDGSDRPVYQYTASRGSAEEPMTIIVRK